MRVRAYEICVDTIFWSICRCGIFVCIDRSIVMCHLLAASAQAYMRLYEHAVMLYGKLEKRVAAKKFIDIMKKAVEIEIEFIIKAIPCRMIGMNSKSLILYIKFIADRLEMCN